MRDSSFTVFDSFKAAVKEMYEVLTSDLQLSGLGLLEVREPCHFGYAFQYISPVIRRHLEPVGRQLNVMLRRIVTRASRQR